MLRGHPQRLLVVGGAGDDQHGAEDLLAVDRHVGGDVVEQGRSEVEALLMPFHGEAATVGEECRPLVDALLDVALDPLDGRPCDQGAVVDVGCERRGPTRSWATRSVSLAASASAVSCPTGTATEMAMQRSPAEPYPEPISASTA